MTIKFVDPIKFLHTLTWKINDDGDEATDIDWGYVALLGDPNTTEHCYFCANIDETTVRIDLMYPFFEKGISPVYNGATVFLDPNKNLIPLVIKIVKDSHK